MNYSYCAGEVRSLLLTAAAAVGIVALGATPRLHALTPESPEVKALVAKGIKFIEEVQDERLGAKALFALTLLKAEMKPNHPKIQDALAGMRAAVDNKSKMDELDVYSLCLCLIFLTEHDAKGNQKEIRAFLDRMLEVQKPNGGWGYLNDSAGDTSMTQYAVLSMWELSHNGIPTPQAPWENVASWLLRTQDPNGAWGYHGNDPGSMQLVAQHEIRESMAAAGLGSMYICADQFQFRRRAPLNESKVPEALQAVKKPGANQNGAVKTNPGRVDLNALGAALDRGDEWMQKNYKIRPAESADYFLYAFERYQAFRELSTSPNFKPANWYDEGVALLTKEQTPSGSWENQWGAGPDTAFALLFLLRSSKRSIEKVNHLGPGTLISGRGLPTGTEFDMRRGQARTKPLAGPAEQLLAAIEDPSNPNFDRAVEGLEDRVDQSSPGSVNKLADRLRKLAGGNSPDARAAALRALARTRDLDNVPLIIDALADPDDEVFVAAEEALMFMSRTIPDRGENDGITPARRARSQKKWRDWYLSIRPYARLED